MPALLRSSLLLAVVSIALSGCMGDGGADCAFCLEEDFSTEEGWPTANDEARSTRSSTASTSSR